MDMTENYEALRKRFGTHSKAARHLGISVNHYTFVRKSGRMSGPLRRLIAKLAEEAWKERHLPPPEPKVAA